MTLTPNQEQLAKQLRGEYAKNLNRLRIKLSNSVQLEKDFYNRRDLARTNIKDGTACAVMMFLSFFVFCPISIWLGWKYISLFFFLLTIYFFIEMIRGETKADNEKQKLRNSHDRQLNIIIAEQNNLLKQVDETIKNGLIDRHIKAEQTLIEGNQGSLDKKEFVEASRALMEFQRGDAITIYDEAKIQNDLEALTIKASYEIKGDHIDNRQSVYIEKIDQSSTIHQAATDSTVESESDAKREILKLLYKTPSGRASIVELMVSIKADELIIRKALDSLMIQDLVKIGNREDGVIVYSIDYLTS